MTVLVLQAASTRAGIVAFNSWNTHSKTCRRHLIREWLEVRLFVLLEDFVGGVSLENPLRDVVHILLDYTHHLLHLVKALEQAVE